MSRPEVAIALDFPALRPALDLVDQLGDEVDLFKVGLELFTREGPGIVRELRDRGARVFLDLKLHDIPNTVAGAVAAAAEEGVELLTVHVVGGEPMLRAAVKAAEAAEAANVESASEATDGAAGTPPQVGGAAGIAPDPDGTATRLSGTARTGLTLLGVTVLTSLSAADLGSAWGRDPGRDPLDVEGEVLRLGSTAVSAGLGGLVASAGEVAALRRRLGSGVTLVTPGIRISGGEAHDQQRVTTPAEAVSAGADILVVGRTVTRADAPLGALRRVLEEVRGAGAEEASVETWARAGEGR